MSVRAMLCLVGLAVCVAACAPAIQMETVAVVPQPDGVARSVGSAPDDSYQPVPARSAEILGCGSQTNSAAPDTHTKSTTHGSCASRAGSTISMNELSTRRKGSVKFFTERVLT